MSRVIDLTNQIFGQLTVIERAENTISDNRAQWLCKCNCGNLCIVRGTYLRTGKTKSCGCIRKENNSSNLLNKKFGKLTVIEKTNQRASRGIIWKCLCECGNICYISTNNLITKHTQSCGCNHLSIGEQNIIDILEQNKIKYIKEYTPSNLIFNDTKFNGRFDFYLPDYNRLIEYDGEQHFNQSEFFNSSLEYIQNHDKIKNQWAIDNNITLIRIPYWERDNITLQMIMGTDYLIKSC